MSCYIIHQRHNRASPGKNAFGPLTELHCLPQFCAILKAVCAANPSLLQKQCDEAVFAGHSQLLLPCLRHTLPGRKSGGRAPAPDDVPATWWAISRTQTQPGTAPADAAATPPHVLTSGSQELKDKRPRPYWCSFVDGPSITQSMQGQAANLAVHGV